MKTYIYISLCLAVIFASCTEPIELDLNTENNVRLVVNAELTSASKAHLVDLSLTTDYFQEGIPDRAENANVTISDGTNTEVLTELAPGKYYTSDNFAGEENVEYTLTIDYDGETYTSMETLLPVTALDSISYIQYDDPEDQEIYYSQFAHFQEPSAQGEYYLFRLKINDEFYGNGISDWFFTDDSAVNGSYISADFYTFQAELGDTITFEQMSISKEVYENLNAVLLETEWRGGLFDGAPANVPANVNNGAVGAFIVSDIESKQFVIE